MKRLIFIAILVLARLLVHAQGGQGPENYTFNICEGDTVVLGIASIEGVVRIWPEFGPFLSFYGDSVLAYAENTSDTIVIYQNLLVSYVAENTSFFTDTLTVNIYPQPVEDLPELNYGICSGDTIPMYYEPVEGGYMYALPEALCEVDTIGSPNIRLFPTTSTLYQLYVTNAGGCSIGPYDLNVNVQSISDSIAFALYDTICYTSQAFSLESMIFPLSASVSGPGVGIGNFFYPALAGEGLHTLTLSTGSGSCLVELQKSIRILGESDVSFGDLPNYCQNDPKILLNTGVPAGGIYGVNELESIFLEPYLLPLGEQLLKYSFVGADGCNITKSQLVFIKSIPERPELIVNGNTATCSGDTLVLGASLSAPRYIWSTGDTTQYIYAYNQAFYYVSINASNGCRNYSDTLFLGFYPSPLTNLFSPAWPNGYNVSAPDAGDGSIYLNIQGGAPPYTIEWSNGATTEDLVGLSSGLYVVTLTDTGGCITRDSIFLSDPVNTSIGQIEAEGEFRGIKIPNGFTPNGDGFNDTWKMNGLSPVLEQNEVMIFDVRGKLVYRMQNYREQWDGRDLNGNVLSEGDYFWIFRSANAAGMIKGSVNVMR